MATPVLNTKITVMIKLRNGSIMWGFPLGYVRDAIIAGLIKLSTTIWQKRLALSHFV